MNIGVSNEAPVERLKMNAKKQDNTPTPEQAEKEKELLNNLSKPAPDDKTIIPGGMKKMNIPTALRDDQKIIFRSRHEHVLGLRLTKNQALRNFRFKAEFHLCTFTVTNQLAAEWSDMCGFEIKVEDIVTAIVMSPNYGTEIMCVSAPGYKLSEEADKVNKAILKRIGDQKVGVIQGAR